MLLKRAFTTSPIAKGSIIRRTSDFAIFNGSTETPFTRKGNTSGKYPTDTIMSRTIRATENAMLPLLSRANKGRNGAPAAVPSKISATPKGSSRRSNRAVPNAAMGIKMKFAISARETSLRLRRGSRICVTPKLRPTANMLETTKMSMVTGTALLRSSIKNSDLTESNPIASVATSHPARAVLCTTFLPASGASARFFQNVSSDSMPPNRVVNMVESANNMSPARASWKDQLAVWQEHEWTSCPQS